MCWFLFNCYRITIRSRNLPKLILFVFLLDEVYICELPIVFHSARQHVQAYIYTGGQGRLHNIYTRRVAAPPADYPDLLYTTLHCN